MGELLTVTEGSDKIVVTEQDGVTLVTVIAPGPQGVPGSSILPDASATVKGALKLHNDLGGTAENPTVPGLALKASMTYVDAQDDLERSEREAADTALLVEIDEKYDLPALRVARTELDASTRASLAKADTALQVAPVTSVAGKTGAVTVTKADVGLGSAENTSDLAKSISTATQTALTAKADTAALTSHTSNVSNPHAVTRWNQAR